MCQVDRINILTVYRMERERRRHPVVSHYLQALVELSTALRTATKLLPKPSESHQIALAFVHAVVDAREELQGEATDSSDAGATSAAAAAVTAAGSKASPLPPTPSDAMTSEAASTSDDSAVDAMARLVRNDAPVAPEVVRSLSMLAGALERVAWLSNDKSPKRDGTSSAAASQAGSEGGGSGAAAGAAAGAGVAAGAAAEAVAAAAASVGADGASDGGGGGGGGKATASPDESSGFGPEDPAPYMRSVPQQAPHKVTPPSHTSLYVPTLEHGEGFGPEPGVLGDSVAGVWRGGVRNWTVASRNSPSKRSTRTMKPGVHVVRSRSWKWDDQDGASSSPGMAKVVGKVLAFTTWNGVPKAAVVVRWQSEQTAYPKPPKHLICFACVSIHRFNGQMVACTRIGGEARAPLTLRL